MWEWLWEYPFGSVMWTSFLCVLGFLISVGLNVGQKYIFVEFKFVHPLWLMGTHMAASYVLASAWIYYFDSCESWGIRRKSGIRRVVLSFREQATVVLPFSTLGALCLALGNWTLVYIYPSSNVMLQNTTALWTVLISLLLTGKTYSFSVYATMLPITVGGMMCVQSESLSGTLTAQFPVWGVFLSLSTAAVRAAKTVLQSALLQGTRVQRKLDSVTLLYYSAALNICLFLGGSFLSEGGLQPYWDFLFQLELRAQVFIVACAVGAAVYNLIWNKVMASWGAVWTTVVGTLKVPSTILLSHLVFGNPVEPMQIAGFLLTTAGTVCYSGVTIKEGVTKKRRSAISGCEPTKGANSANGVSHVTMAEQINANSASHLGRTGSGRNHLAKVS